MLDKRQDDSIREIQQDYQEARQLLLKNDVKGFLDILDKAYQRAVDKYQSKRDISGFDYLQTIIDQVFQHYYGPHNDFPSSDEE